MSLLRGNDMKADKIQLELRDLARQNKGLIMPRDVVDRARDKESALHSWFTWDDSEAAEKHRLYEARQLLRVVVIKEDSQQAPVRALVSLKSDRKVSGGYRLTANVMNDDDMRQEMLNDALEELRYFENKYNRIKELSPVFDAASKVKRRAVA